LAALGIASTRSVAMSPSTVRRFTDPLLSHSKKRFLLQCGRTLLTMLNESRPHGQQRIELEVARSHADAARASPCSGAPTSPASAHDRATTGRGYFNQKSPAATRSRQRSSFSQSFSGGVSGDWRWLARLDVLHQPDAMPSRDPSLRPTTENRRDMAVHAQLPRACRSVSHQHVIPLAPAQPVCRTPHSVHDRGESGFASPHFGHKSVAARGLVVRFMRTGHPPKPFRIRRTACAWEDGDCRVPHASRISVNGDPARVPVSCSTTSDGRSCTDRPECSA